VVMVASGLGDYVTTTAGKRVLKTETHTRERTPEPTNGMR
jgi:hypothetical protein